MIGTTETPKMNPKLLLETELVRRTQKNPGYSLRAFARALGVSHSGLSLVLAGKRPLSRRMAEKVAVHLGLNPAEKGALLRNRKANLVEKGERSVDASGGEAYKRIDLTTFELISSWVHYAILSLLSVSHSRFEARWIAKRLGVSPIHAKCAMERLKELGLVGTVGKRWRQTGLPIKVENEISTAATRNFHRQLLEKAMESLENDPIEKRDFSSMTMAIDPKLLPYAKERIREFRRQLTKELESRGRPKIVYNLTVQIYPVSK